MIAKARRVIGYGGAFPPYDGNSACVRPCATRSRPPAAT